MEHHQHPRVVLILQLGGGSLLLKSMVQESVAESLRKLASQFFVTIADMLGVIQSVRMEAKVSFVSLYLMERFCQSLRLQ